MYICFQTSTPTKRPHSDITGEELPNKKQILEVRKAIHIENQAIISKVLNKKVNNKQQDRNIRLNMCNGEILISKGSLYNTIWNKYSVML